MCTGGLLLRMVELLKDLQLDHSILGARILEEAMLWAS